MAQVLNAQPETQSLMQFGDDEKAQNPLVGSPEHAELLKAIRQNFPEIFEDSPRSGIRKTYGELTVWSSSNPAETCA